MWSIGDEHVAGCVKDDQRRLGFDGDRLRCDAARPEHRNRTVGDPHGVAVVRRVQIGNAKGPWITDMYRSAVRIAGNRDEMSTADAMSAGANGLIDTTSGPSNGPAPTQRRFVTYIGTLTPCS